MSSARMERASAIATWIVIEVMDRNPAYFADRISLQEFGEKSAHQSLDFAGNGRYFDALDVCRKFLSRIVIENKKLITDDPELFDAIGALAQLDASFRVR